MTKITAVTLVATTGNGTAAPGGRTRKREATLLATDFTTPDRARPFQGRREPRPAHRKPQPPGAGPAPTPAPTPTPAPAPRPTPRRRTPPAPAPEARPAPAPTPRPQPAPAPAMTPPGGEQPGATVPMGYNRRVLDETPGRRGEFGFAPPEPDDRVDQVVLPGIVEPSQHQWLELIGLPDLDVDEEEVGYQRRP